jgi:hypothetical protein
MREASRDRARILLQYYQTHACNPASLGRSPQFLRNGSVPPVDYRYYLYCRLKVLQVASLELLLAVYINSLEYFSCLMLA